MKKHKYFIGIMHTNRIDMLNHVMRVLGNERVILLDNSDNRELKKIVKSPTQPLSYSQGMNAFRDKAIKEKVDFIITMHEDIKITKKTVEDLKTYIDATISMVDDWGIILTNEDSVAVYNIRLLKELAWDTRLPDYFSDTDYQYWAKIKRFEVIQSDVDVIHYRSQTILSDPKKEFTNSITYPLYELYYMSKTGGKRGQERFNIPFNNPLYE